MSWRQNNGQPDKSPTEHCLFNRLSSILIEIFPHLQFILFKAILMQFK